MGSTVQVKVPDIGDFDAVEVIEVLVATGDAVEVETPLISLESDKATMDVPSDAAGVVQNIAVQVGDKVAEGAVILELEVAGGAEDGTGVSDVAGDGAGDVGADDGAAGDSATTDAPADTDVHTSDAQPLSTAPPAAPPPPALVVADTTPPPPSAAPSPSTAKPHAAPGVHRFARELGAPLSQVPGSAAHGRVTREDVQQYVRGALSSGASGVGGGAMPAIPSVDFSQFGEVELQPLNRVRKISGPRLHGAWLNIPHVTHHDEADVTELEALRNSLKNDALEKGVRLTALAFIAKALARALEEHPNFNVSLATDGEHLVVKKYIHIGIAVDTPNGLLVPVLRDVDTKGVLSIAAEMAEAGKRARDGKLKKDDMQGGCMTISSLGGIGGRAFTPIVNAPEVAILGVSRSHLAPLWNKDKAAFEPRLMLPLDLSYDHRVIDGAEAARFTAHLCHLLGNISLLLL